MKRVLALILTLVAVLGSVSALSGCAPAEDDFGAEIQMYFVGELYDFDPAKAYTNDDAMKVMSLIYEPLFRLDANGDVQYALADSYRFYTDHFGEFLLDITIRDTYWNDGEAVTAEDVVYAWQRILSPDFPCQAATLLYDIKNARAAKKGEVSFYNAAIYAQKDTVTIGFEKELSSEEQTAFLRNLTSIALTPVREEAITKSGREETWAKRVAYISTNGPFAIRACDHSRLSDKELSFRLERNNYYRRDPESEGNYDMYVTPYKLASTWNEDVADAVDAFLENSYFFVGDIDVERRAQLLSSAHVTNLLSTYTYVLDNTDPVFADARVRRAFSLVLDRTAIANSATGGLSVPATGFVSHGVLNGFSGSFADVTAASAAAIANTADFETAKALLLEAKDDGYSGGTVKILVRDNEEETAIAEAVKTAWKQLMTAAGVSGNVQVYARTYNSYEIYENKGDKNTVTIYEDAIQEASRVSDTSSGFGAYNVIAMDYQMLSLDAACALATFSTALNGNGIHMDVDPAQIHFRTNISGYSSTDYDALIDSAYTLSGAARTAALHNAEAKLLEDMPVIPLFFNRSASLVSSELSRVYFDYYGYAVFTRTEMRYYRSHLIEEK